MELDLLTSPVGLIALSAGVANDVVGWTLLGVSVALAQASSGEVAIYMLLCSFVHRSGVTIYVLHVPIARKYT